MGRERWAGSRQQEGPGSLCRVYVLTGLRCLGRGLARSFQYHLPRSSEGPESGGHERLAHSLQRILKQLPGERQF